MQAEVGDPSRPAALADLPLPAPAAPTGDVRIEVAVERAGRSVTALSARLLQGGRLCVVALAALSPATSRRRRRLRAADARRRRRPRELEPSPAHPGAPPIAHRLSLRPVFGGPPFAGAGEALTGGWLRVAEPSPVDAPALGASTPTPGCRRRSRA